MQLEEILSPETAVPLSHLAPVSPELPLLAAAAISSSSLAKQKSPPSRAPEPWQPLSFGDMVRMVSSFHRASGDTVVKSPSLPPKERARLRVSLLQEELDEMLENHDQQGLLQMREVLENRFQDLESGLLPSFRMLDSVEEPETVLEKLQMDLNAKRYLRRLLDRIKIEETT